MALVTLTFNNQPLNTSCQVGDTAYYVSTSNNLKGATNDFLVNSDNVTEIGVIVQITNPLTSPVLIVRALDSFPGSSSDLTGKYIFFSKDNKANLSSPLGYFASVKMVNNSATQSELHAVNAGVFTSSK